MPNRARRALLFMPGDERRKIEKGAAMDVDCIVMDLEDGVALNRKDEARMVVRAALEEVHFGKTERLVRINPVSDDSSLWFHDLTETIEAQPDGYMIPKVHSSEPVLRVAEHITRIERKNGWPEGKIRLLALIETALGFVNLRDICESDPRLVALVFGAEDLAGDMGAIRTPDGWEVFYARSKLVLFAKAYGLQAIDTPFVDLTAEDSQLITQAEQAHYMAYNGKLAIHPKQVPLIQAVFTPKVEEVQYAKALIEAHDQYQKEGKGVFSFHGKMIDMPMIRAAESVLARAKAAGLEVDEI